MYVQRLFTTGVPILEILIRISGFFLHEPKLGYAKKDFFFLKHVAKRRRRANFRSFVYTTYLLNLYLKLLLWLVKSVIGFLFNRSFRNIHIECSNRTYTFMCLGREGHFGQCFKIQIWNLDRLTHIQFNVRGRV